MTGAPGIERLEHWTLVASDVERSKRFYLDVMGAKPPERVGGPTTGARTVNGAMVMARYSATRPRASSVGTEKKTVEASATVIMTSPAPFTACSSISLPSPDSPAPCACVALRMPTLC